MRKIILSGLILLIFLTIGCTQKIVCNKPYILVGSECCLDSDGNNICDKDETKNEITQAKEESIETKSEESKITEQTKPVVTEEDKFKEIARKFGRFMEQDEYGDLYDILTPERQSYKTKDEFIKLYPLIFGRGTYTSILLNTVDIESEDLAFANYDGTYSTGFKETSPSYYFKKIGDEWRFDGFSLIVYAGCFNLSDCYKKPDKLTSMCKETCKEQTNNPLRDESGKEFSCSNHICQCICFDETTRIGKHVEPDVKYLH